jgi:hypothetical protein
MPMATSRKSSRSKAVWDRPAPKKVAKRGTKHLSPAQREHAKKRAQRAGRNYPNMVDNIREAAEANKSKPKRAKKTAARSSGASKRKRSAPKRAGASKRKRSSARKTAAGINGASKRGAPKRAGASKRKRSSAKTAARSGGASKRKRSRK